MKPHDPPPMDATENVWRAHMADQLASIHLCFEERMDATDSRVETYHAENRQGREQVLSAIDEIKHELRASQTWISSEETQRERDALLEAGKQIERERWLSWWHRLEHTAEKLLDWGAKLGAGVVFGYLGHYFGFW